MDAQIGMNASQNQTGKKRENEELNNFHFYPLLRLLERLGQNSDIVIEQFEVVGDLGFAANRRHHHDNLSSGHSRNAVRRLYIEIWLNQFELGVLAFHQVDQLDGVRRSGRNSWARFNVADYVESEVLSKVGP